MRCFLLNARSIANKLDHLHSLVHLYKPDLVFATETWLNSRIFDSEIEGNLTYYIYRADRSSRKGGGVFCLLKGMLTLNNVERYNISHSSILCTDIVCANYAYLIRFITIYRPPTFERDKDDELLELLRNLVACHYPTIILGDLNLHIDWKNMRAVSLNAKPFFDFFCRKRICAVRTREYPPGQGS